ncbi:hypothetical protein ID0469_04690 [Helicobacter pylori]
MSGLKTFSCVVVLCGAMANVAVASPKIEARGELGKFLGGAVGGVQWVVQWAEQLGLLEVQWVLD